MTPRKTHPSSGVALVAALIDVIECCASIKEMNDSAHRPGQKCRACSAASTRRQCGSEKVAQPACADQPQPAVVHDAAEAITGNSGTSAARSSYRCRRVCPASTGSQVRIQQAWSAPRTLGASARPGHARVRPSTAMEQRRASTKRAKHPQQHKDGTDHGSPRPSVRLSRMLEVVSCSSRCP